MQLNGSNFKIKGNTDIIIEPDSNESPFYRESTCETVNNRIYFYSDIERENALILNRTLREIGNELTVRQINEETNDQKIFLHINSNGGSVFMGLSCMDEILNSKIPVHTIIDGCCASAATFLSIVGAKRYIHKHAFILIHQISSDFYGKYDDFLDHKENLDKFMHIVKNIYLKHTKMTELDIEKLIKHDLWLDAKTALDYGFVDEIL